MDLIPNAMRVLVLSSRPPPKVEVSFFIKKSPDERTLVRIDLL